MTLRPRSARAGRRTLGPAVGLVLVALTAVACSGTSVAPVATVIPSGGIGSGAATAGASDRPPGTPPPVAVPTQPAPNPSPTPAPTEGPTPAETPSGSGPLASILPEVTSFAAPHSASCTGANGTAAAGQIHLSWDAVGTSGVRLSIDPPSADVAYDYGFADYAATGSTDVPFSCGAPNHDTKGAYHLYVVTTLHDKGYAMYRFAKVYEVTP